MIELDEDLLLADLYYTAIEINDFPKNRFVANNYEGFNVLNEMLAYNFGKVLVLRNNKNKENANETIFKKNIKGIDEFVRYVDTNQDIILELSKNLYNFLEEKDFKPYPFWDVVRSYNEKDFKDIILGFYSSFDSNIYNIAKKYFDENRIGLGYIIDLLEEGEEYDKESQYAGFYSSLPWLDSGYIFSVYDYYDSVSASALVHELGHAIDMERFIFPQKKNILLIGDCLVEVPSTVFEVGFNDYLKENHIDTEGSRILNNCRICDLKKYSEVLKTVIAKEDVEVFPNGFAIDEKNNKYDLRTSILYGLGYYFALHLNILRKNDMKAFLKALNKITTLRKEMNLEQAILASGFNVEDFVSCKYIKEDIENNLMELKKRYKC